MDNKTKILEKTVIRRLELQECLPAVNAVIKMSGPFPFIEEDTFFRIAFQENSFGVVAEHNKQIIAYMQCRELCWGGYQLMHSIVDPEFQGKDVDQKMIRYLLNTLWIKRDTAIQRFIMQYRSEKTPLAELIENLNKRRYIIIAQTNNINLETKCLLMSNNFTEISTPKSKLLVRQLIENTNSA